MFFLAALTFILLLAEPMLNTLFNVSGFSKTILTRAICIVIWAFGSKGLLVAAKKECNFEIFKKEKTLTTLQWIILSIVSTAVLGYFVWNKFSVLKIIANNISAPKVIVAYISMFLLNTAKAFVITIFIAFIQKGLTVSFKKAKFLPLGGIVLGLLWCGMFLLASAGLSLSWVSLIYQFAYGLILGVLFVLADNKSRYAFPFVLVTTLFIFLY